MAGALAELLGDYLCRRLDEDGLAIKLRALADQLGGVPLVEPAEAKTQEEEREIFGYWQRVFGKRTAKLTPERRTKLRARLREGYTTEQIKRAIDGVAASAFHRGENAHHREYIDLTLICQNGSKLEQLAELAGASSSVRSATETQAGQLEELRAQARRELAAGNTDAYTRTESEIRKLSGGNAGVRREPEWDAPKRGGDAGKPVQLSLARKMA